MAFLYEKDLKDIFWDYYRKRKGIVAYQFENTARDGGIDLLTVETYQDKYQICAFEFKLSDIPKAILQAKGNLPYVHKSFIVVPQEKEKLILDKYKYQIEKEKYIGVIGVEEGGRWNIIIQPKLQPQVIFSQEVMRLLFD